MNSKFSKESNAHTSGVDKILLQGASTLSKPTEAKNKTETSTAMH